MSVLATVTRKISNGKFTERILMGNFMLPLLLMTSEVYSPFIHYLIPRAREI